MAASRLQIASLVFPTSNFPGHSTFAWYGDLIARVGSWTIRRVREAWKPSAEFSFLKIEHCIFAKWYVLSEEVMKVVGA